MAIEQAITDTNYGITFDNAYLRVGEVLIKPAKDEVRIDLRGYATAAARDLIAVFEAKRIELDAMRLDPESDNQAITDLENEMGQKPIGIYKERITITFEEFEPHCTGFTKDEIITGCYLYIKTLDKYIDGTDV